MNHNFLQEKKRALYLNNCTVPITHINDKRNDNFSFRPSSGLPQIA